MKAGVDSVMSIVLLYSKVEYLGKIQILYGICELQNLFGVEQESSGTPENEE